MGSYSDHKRTYRANRSHCSLDWQRNDRLGRAGYRIPSPSHRGKILRAIWCADSDPDADSDSDANADRNIYCNSYRDSYVYSNTNGYSNSNAYPDAESFSHTEISADTSA